MKLVSFNLASIALASISCLAVDPQIEAAQGDVEFQGDVYKNAPEESNAKTLKGEAQARTPKQWLAGAQADADGSSTSTAAASNIRSLRPPRPRPRPPPKGGFDELGELSEKSRDEEGDEEGPAEAEAEAAAFEGGEGETATDVESHHASVHPANEAVIHGNHYQKPERPQEPERPQKPEVQSNPDKDVPKTYIVTYSKTADLDAEEVVPSEAKAQTLAAAYGGKVRFAYERALNGAAIALTAKAAAALRQDPSVESVEEDGRFYKTTNQWGQDRIDQCGSVLDGAPYSPKPATDAKIYVLDSGVYAGHDDFAGGMIDVDSSCHESFFFFENPLVDNDGHGTHVASTICGNQYGVAACGTANLCSVQVLDSFGFGSDATVIGGVEHSIIDCEAHGGPCVINMSLVGPFSRACNEAVANAVAEGVAVVVAAGNAGGDACDESPASAAEAITVGATKEGDALAFFTNVGPCVDIFAPGADIVAASILSRDATISASGTSMSSPVVAGLAAARLHADKELSASQVSDVLRADATFLHVDCNWPGTGIAAVGGLGCAEVNPSCPDATPAPSGSPTISPTSVSDEAFCASRPGTKLVKVEVNTDFFPLETSWTLVNACTLRTLESVGEGEYTDEYAAYTFRDCLDADVTYEFTIYDSFGDGIGAPGNYTVTFGGEVVAEGAGFEDSETMVFGDQCSPTVSPAPTPVVTSFCDPQPGTKLAEVEVRTDIFPLETSWKLVNACTDVVEKSVTEGEYTEGDTVYTSRDCVDADSTYEFTIYDSFGDGLGGEGYYSVAFGGEVVASGDEFEGNETTVFGDQCAPTVSPVPTNAPTVFDGVFCASQPGTKLVKVEVNTDFFPRETSWTLVNACTGAIEASVIEGEYTEGDAVYTSRECVDEDYPYEFTIYDAAADGICCFNGLGEYSVTFGDVPVASGGEFGYSDTASFGEDRTCEPTSMPSLPPTPSSHPDDCFCDSQPATELVRVDVLTDDWPHETSWTLVDLCTDELVASAGGYAKKNALLTSRTCHANNSAYKFTISDSYGDGLIYGGYYNVTYRGEGVATGSCYGKGETKTFGECV